MLFSIIKFFNLHLNFAMVLLGYIVGTPFVWFKNKKSSFIKTMFECLVFSIGSTLAVLVFATIEHYLGSGEFIFGAVSTYGVYLVFAPVLYICFKLFKKDSREIFNDYAVFAIITLFFVRIICIKEGCCAGKPLFNTGFNIPTRESELVFFVIMLYYLLKKKPDNSFVILAINYSVFRFFVEFLRVSESTGLFHIAHLWSIIAFVVYYLIYVRQKAQLYKN